MEIVVSRSHVADPGTWLRDPSKTFMLTVSVSFSHEERWIIEAHSLYHHVVFDRTPPWYLPALREAQRAKERTERDGARFEWPWYLPASVPPEWIVTIRRLLERPVFVVRFNSAAELDAFEPRLMAAFANLKRFLSRYSARPHTVAWRF